MEREAPERLGDDPEQAREAESPDQCRGWRVTLARLLAREQIDREGHSGPGRLRDPDPVERARVVRAHDEQAPRERQRGCAPQTDWQRPAVHELEPYEQQQ